jgi:bacterial/archaeal transporter family protein
MNWSGYAIVGALAAGFTAVLAKLGMQGIPSNLAMAIRTTVVLAIAWSLVWSRGEHAALPSVGARAWILLALSGIATGISWLAYFKALSLAPAARVAPLDKLSLAFTVFLAWLILGETLSWQTLLGAALMIAGAILTLG